VLARLSTQKQEIRPAEDRLERAALWDVSAAEADD